MYQGIDAHQVSLNERSQKNLSSDNNLTYGEVIFSHFIPILEYADPRPGEVLWDLGCGAGRPLIAASLAYPEL